MSDIKAKMKGKLRRGRPPKHGGYSLLIRRGELPEDRRYITRYLTDVRTRIIENLGPTEDDMSGVQIVLLDRLISLLGCVRCWEEAAKEGKAELNKHYLSFNNTIAKICNLLGIEKKVTDEALSPLEYIRQFDEQKARKALEKGQEKPEFGPERPRETSLGEYEGKRKGS